MAIKISVTANTPFEFPSDIINDSFPPPDEESEAGADIPSIYANTDINFDITFSYEVIVESEPPQIITAPIIEIELLEELPLDGAVFTVVSSDTINISGRSTGLFIDEIFRFLFADKSEKDLLPDNTEDWLSIIKWQKPSKIEELISYKLRVHYGANLPIIPAGIADIDLTQFAYWNFEPSLAVFKDLVDESAERLKIST